MRVSRAAATASSVPSSRAVSSCEPVPHQRDPVPRPPWPAWSDRCSSGRRWRWSWSVGDAGGADPGDRGGGVGAVGAVGPGGEGDEHGGGVAVDDQGLPVGDEPDLLRAQRGPFGGGDAAAGGGVSGVQGGGDLGDVGVADEGGEPVQRLLVLQAAQDQGAVQVGQDLPAVVLAPAGVDLRDGLERGEPLDPDTPGVRQQPGEFRQGCDVGDLVADDPQRRVQPAGVGAGGARFGGVDDLAEQHRGQRCDVGLGLVVGDQHQRVRGVPRTAAGSKTCTPRWGSICRITVRDRIGSTFCANVIRTEDRVSSAPSDWRRAGFSPRTVPRPDACVEDVAGGGGPFQLQGPGHDVDHGAVREGGGVQQAGDDDPGGVPEERVGGVGGVGAEPGGERLPPRHRGRGLLGAGDGVPDHRFGPARHVQGVEHPHPALAGAGFDDGVEDLGFRGGGDERAGGVQRGADHQVEGFPGAGGGDDPDLVLQRQHHRLTPVGGGPQQQPDLGQGRGVDVQQPGLHAAAAGPRGLLPGADLPGGPPGLRPVGQPDTARVDGGGCGSPTTQPPRPPRRGTATNTVRVVTGSARRTGTAGPAGPGSAARAA